MPETETVYPQPSETWTFASLKVSTNNLGDHIQVIASKGLLERFGILPSVHIDHDDDITTCKEVSGEGPIALLINGWFKTNGGQWPPHPRIIPLFLGFHIRLPKCPELLSPEALRYYKRHAPLGCRDPYTKELLEAQGIESFASQCLSLTFPRRHNASVNREAVLVVSRDERILKVIPADLGRISFVSHYSDSFEYEPNERRARALLGSYRKNAKLIVTTLLHCALPAIAMGIPVVVFYPENHERGRASD